MKEIHAKLSMWARLYRRWEGMDPVLRGKAPAAGEGGTGISAMEVELRAMQAKADVASDDARAESGNR